jgi:hypothetical protein
LLPGKSRAGGWYHDFVGSGSDQDQLLWLRYYATDADRETHRSRWPEEAIPPREKPPHSRDWRLPKGPF